MAVIQFSDTRQRIVCAKALLVCFFLFNLVLLPSKGYALRKTGHYEAHLNILYSIDTTQQTLDYYLPAGRNPHKTPIVVLLHGGAWVTGDKSDYSNLGADTVFTNAGIAVVNMNYRLDGTYAYPAPLDDIGMVMKYIKKHAKKWHVNPNKVCLVGRSSGGQLALLYAYSRNAGHRIKAVVECCAPVNFTDSSVVKGPLGINVTYWLGEYTTHRQLWHDASPLYYMQGAVPTVILHGLKDDLVLPVQTKMLQDSLYIRGVPSMFVAWPEKGHGWNEQQWNTDKDPVIKWIKNFL